MHLRRNLDSPFESLLNEVCASEGTGKLSFSQCLFGTTSWVPTLLLGSTVHCQNQAGKTLGQGSSPTSSNVQRPFPSASGDANVSLCSKDIDVSSDQLVNDTVRTATVAPLPLSKPQIYHTEHCHHDCSRNRAIAKTNLKFLVRRGFCDVLGQQPVVLSPCRTRGGGGETKPLSQALS